MVIVDALLNFIYQFIYLFGILIVVCFIVGLCKKLFYRQLGQYSRKVSIACGIIGTPIHESGHALMCVLFGHKVKKIVFFQPSCKDEKLGYVEHNYNRKNIYQVIGNFFIGIGPILLGTAVLTLLLFLLCRNVFTDLMQIVEQNSSNSGDMLSSESLLRYWYILKRVLFSLFNPENLISITWWIYMFFSFSISLHMGLSGPDIKCSWGGLFASALILLIVNLVVGLISSVALAKMNYYVILASNWMFCFLSVSVIISVALLVFAFIINHLIRLIRFKKW